MKKIISLGFFILIVGCSSSPKESQLLPDSGPTTREIINREEKRQVYFGGSNRADYQGIPIAKQYAPGSSFSNSHMDELRRDFQRVPNPEILGYIYSHIKDNALPVSGHFTVFKLYENDQYALSSEGHYGQ